VALVVADTLGETTHEQSFPLTVRSRKYGEFINDLDTVGAQPALESAKNIMDKHSSFIDRPMPLPGANFSLDFEIK
jgi:hypothetical protein